MTKEQIKAKAKEQVSNDEFAQQIIIDAINWATKELQEENAELQADNDARKFAMAMSEKVEKKLREENEKAKEIIKKLISDNRKVWVYSDVREEAEQFLKE